MPTDKKPEEQLTPEQNLDKMQKVQAGFRGDLKRAFVMMNRAQDRLVNAVNDSAPDVYIRRFRSDVEQAHNRIMTAYSKLDWARWKLAQVKNIAGRAQEEKVLKEHTNSQGSLCHFPLKALKSFQLEQ